MNEGKRLTNAELAAAYWFMRWVRSTALRFSKVGGPSTRDNERLAAMRRFASLPHYDDPEHYDDEPLMDGSALEATMKAMSAKLLEQQAQLDAVRAQVEIWEAQNTEGDDLASHVSREAFRLACLRIRAALKTAK